MVYVTDCSLMVVICRAELAFSTRSSVQSDVYSYGVMVLELITRTRAVDPQFPDNMNIVNWVSSRLNGSDQIKAVCDPDLMEEVFGTVEMEQVRKVLAVALPLHDQRTEPKAAHGRGCEEVDGCKANSWRRAKSKQDKLGSQSSSYLQ
jgi:hypothetical protein